MTGLPRILLTGAVFVATLVLVIKRPRGLPEAVWTVAGAVLVLALGLLAPASAWDAVTAAKGALLFLLALLVLSALVEKSGFFEWAAIHAARLAKGDARALYRNVFVLGALITAALSLDTTAVILTPLVLAFVQRLRLPARPYVFACAFVANNASLFLPVSNLTNLLFAGTFRFSFLHFAARMLVPQIVALLVNYAVFCRLFAAELPASFDASLLPEPASVVPNRGYFRAAAAVLGLVLAGYFVAPLAHLEPYMIGGAGAAVLLGVGVATGRVRGAIVKDVSWSVFPFVVGLFIVVRAALDAGLRELSATWFARVAPPPPLDVIVPSIVTTVASNLINNLPAGLLARGTLEQGHASEPAIYGALLGTNLGPNITIVGSLATLLVLSSAKKKGVSLGAGDLLRIGGITTPLVLLAAGLALAATFLVVR
jgi:arsenical pump membrane protein